MRKKFSTVISLVVVLAMLFTGCASNNSGTANDSKAPEATGKEDKNTLVVATGADARVLDPHQSGDSNSNNALYPVVETLVMYDEKGEIIPWLAEKWEQLSPTSWKFYLRKGVKFHNGEEMKASDVKFSFDRATSPKGAKVSYIMKIVDSAKTEIIDDYTIVIHTTKPFSPFVGYLPYIGAAIISEKAYADPATEMYPVGTGPFEFVEWKKGDRLIYKRFNDYWGQKAAFENLIIRAIPEVNSRVIELETGAVDIAIGLTVNDEDKVASNTKLKWLTSPTTVFTTLNFNCEKAPFDNLKFRQALDYAIDEEAVVKAVYRGKFAYTPGPVTPHQKYFDDSENKARFDVAKAKQLLAESGVNVAGKKFAIVTNENQARIDIATIVQSQLKDNLGIDVEIKVMETATFFDYIVKNEKDMFMNGWGAVGFPEPDNNIYGPYHSAQIPQNNTTSYRNPQLDEMLDKSRELADSPEREQLIKDIQKVIRDGTASVTFDNPVNMVGTQSYIEGFIVQPTSHQIYNKVVIK